MRAARDCIEQALPILREVGDQPGETGCLDSLGYVHLWMGDYGAAVRCYEQALELARQARYRRGEVNVLFHLGHFYNHVGLYARGKGYLQEGLAMARQERDRRRIAYHLLSASVSERGLGEVEAACESARQAVAVLQEIGDGGGEGAACSVLADACLDLGQWAEAAEAARRALALCPPATHPAAALHGRVRLARALLRMGDLAVARELVDGVLHDMENGADAAEVEEGPLAAYLGCFQVLSAAGDGRARAILERAHEHLQSQAARIEDEALRRSFLENKPVHRAILAAWPGPVQGSGEARAGACTGQETEP